ncbi:hypothetical protein DL764_000518 [Monosporascus ibericus]|uniref:FAD-binding FR-type domain-containing protein n=1 Tax=Monosporascus ibericus TaxID=155417 RepID=A0A4Q4TV65_9PEZI|nr:hypothetical protein DL764_000518 [Monosporascus ibericus]
MASTAPTTLQDAKTVYDYHRMHMSLRRDVDAVFCLCSLDTRVAERAARLLLDGYGQYLIFAGGAGKLTQDRFSKPEAEVFANIAVQMGVPAEKIITEPRSTNTGENVRFTWELLQQKCLHPRSFILVQKPYMERRTFATFSMQWPDPEAEFMVTSPELEWSGYPNEDNPTDLVINIARRVLQSHGIGSSADEARAALRHLCVVDKDKDPTAKALTLASVMAPLPVDLVKWNRIWPIFQTTNFLEAPSWPDTTVNDEELPPLDRDQLRYLRKLIACILDGRKIAANFNIVLLITLCILALIHLYGKVRNRIKSKLIEDPLETLVFARESPTVDEIAASSSSSSTLEVSSASEDIPKADDIEVERQPLLRRSQTRHGIEGQHVGVLNLLRSWLAYLPPPIPLINQSLPSDGTTIFVLGFYGLNLFCQFYALPLEGRYLVAFADRAGCVFVVNLPILYVLAAKNQPLKALTGYSYDALNIFHRRVGELMCLAAAVHVADMVGCFGLAPKDIKHGWHPADHVFVTIPELGRGYALQAHPFTIASAAPDTNNVSPAAPAHAWLNMLIRVHSSFTSDLLRHAHLNGRASIRLDGQYGSRDALDMLRCSHIAVLVAGGSGIAVVFPLVWDLARRRTTAVRRNVMLYWVVHSQTQRSWIPEERLDELRRCGMHVTIPEPTAEAGRPDIPAYVTGLASAASGTAVRRDADARLRVEKSG